jgi:carboxyl-terminal processing protease
LIGVAANIVVPGALSESEIGEKFAKYPLESDRIKPSFDDDLSDIPYLQRDRIKLLYKFDLQPQLHTYDKYMDRLEKNSAIRIQNNKDYQKFLKDLKKQSSFDEEISEDIQNDLQLAETENIMRDLLYLMLEEKTK